MAIKINQFLNPINFSIIVNFKTKFTSSQSTEEKGFVKDTRIEENTSVLEYIKKRTPKKEEKIIKSFYLVKLKQSLINIPIKNLTNSEQKRVQLAILLLLEPKIMILEHFFEDLIYSEKEYFKRLLRNLMHKQNIGIILIEDDMNFVCETVKECFLFTGKERYIKVTDFYNEEIYKYVKMPYTVELIKYFEKCNHKIDHDITFNETLKSIFRGVS